nr:MAG TPA: hypothetical protein [Caudoviricetes sp.]
MVCDMLHCLEWIHKRDTPLYIPYYNRAAVLACTASSVALVSGIRWRCCGAVIPFSVAQMVLYPLVSVWYCGRWDWSNCRKRPCKALCAVLWRVWYNCMDGTKRTVNACMRLHCSMAK